MKYIILLSLIFAAYQSKANICSSLFAQGNELNELISRSASLQAEYSGLSGYKRSEFITQKLKEGYSVIKVEEAEYFSGDEFPYSNVAHKMREESRTFLVKDLFHNTRKNKNKSIIIPIHINDVNSQLVDLTAIYETFGDMNTMHMKGLPEAELQMLGINKNPHGFFRTTVIRAEKYEYYMRQKSSGY